MDSTASAHLILGSSNSGKTYLATSIVNSSSYPTFIINGYEEDFPSGKNEHISFQDFENNVEDFCNSFIVIDDVVKPSEYECKIISEMLVKHKRHGNMTILLLSHSIERNGLNAIIKHFDYITFTNSSKNTPVFKVYAKKYCPKDFNQSMHTWNDFTQKEAKTHYLRFNNRESKFQIIDSRGNILQNTESKLRKEIARYLKPFGDTELALSLFDYVIRQIPPNSITQDDHILRLKNSVTNEMIEVNILDIVYFPTRKDHDIPPKEEIISAFRSLQKLYSIPFCMIANKHFL